MGIVALAITALTGVASTGFSIAAFVLWGTNYKNSAGNCCTPASVLAIGSSQAACATAAADLDLSVIGSGGSFKTALAAAIMQVVFLILMAIAAWDRTLKFKDASAMLRPRAGEHAGNRSIGLAVAVNQLLVCVAVFVVLLLAYSIGNTARPLESLWTASACPDVYPSSARSFALASLGCWLAACCAGHMIPAKHRTFEDRKKQFSNNYVSIRGPTARRVVASFCVLLVLAALAFAIYYVADDRGYSAAIGTCCSNAHCGVPVSESTAWAGLTVAEQTAAGVLGWVEASWDASGPAPRLESLPWADLTVAQQGAAGVLGWAQPSWDCAVPLVACTFSAAMLPSSLETATVAAKRVAIGALVVVAVATVWCGYHLALMLRGRAPFNRSFSNLSLNIESMKWSLMFGVALAAMGVVLTAYVVGAGGGRAPQELWTAAACTAELPAPTWSAFTAALTLTAAAAVLHMLYLPVTVSDAVRPKEFTEEGRRLLQMTRRE
jgi:hypothetical protein